MTENENSDLGEKEILGVVKEMINSIRKVRVVFSDHKGMEIWETEANIMPGEEVTIKAPTPEDVRPYS